MTITRTVKSRCPLRPINGHSRPQLVTDGQGAWWVEDAPNLVRLPREATPAAAARVWAALLRVRGLPGGKDTRGDWRE